MAECPCTRSIQDAGSICTTCAESLGLMLDRLADLLAELDVTVSRQSRTTRPGSGGGGRRAERPLPYDQRAAEVRAAVTDGLLELARLSQRSTVDPALVCRSLSARTGALRMREDAPLVSRRVEGWLSRAERAVDNPPEKKYVGPCDECGADMYAALSDTWALCRPCGLQYDVEARREWLLSQAPDRLATATEIARFISDQTGLDVSTRLVVMWDKDRRLVRRGTREVSGRERPLYRVGDVLDLVRQRSERLSKKSA